MNRCIVFVYHKNVWTKYFNFIFTIAAKEIVQPFNLTNGDYEIHAYWFYERRSDDRVLNSCILLIDILDL